jgi:hypothetical protein
MVETPMNRPIIAKGAALLRQWYFPWHIGMEFDDEQCFAVIKYGEMTYIRLDGSNGGFLVERPDVDKLGIVMACNTDGFEPGDYDYEVSVTHPDGSAFLSEFGGFTIKDGIKTSESDALPTITSLKPWSMPYTKVDGHTEDLTDQAEFDAEFEARQEAKKGSKRASR